MILPLRIGLESKFLGTALFLIPNNNDYNENEFYVLGGYSDQEIILLFEDIKKKLDNAKAAGKTEEALHNACDDAKKRLVNFDRDRKLHRNNKQWNKSKQFREYINGFRNFINKYAQNLNKIFGAHQLPLVSTLL